MNRCHMCVFLRDCHGNILFVSNFGNAPLKSRSFQHPTFHKPNIIADQHILWISSLYRNPPNVEYYLRVRQPIQQQRHSKNYERYSPAEMDTHVTDSNDIIRARQSAISYRKRAFLAVRNFNDVMFYYSSIVRWINVKGEQNVEVAFKVQVRGSEFSVPLSVK